MFGMARKIAATVIAGGLLAAPVCAQTLQILSAEGDPNSVAAMKWAIGEFKKTHPGVEIEYQTVSFTEIGQKIIAAAAAGSPPDIVHLDDFGESVLADQGLLVPADDVVEAIGRADYFPTPLKAVTFKGTVWGVPFASGFNLLWYRKDLYEKNGLKPPRTWAELLENVKKLNGNLPDVGQMYGIALPLNNSNATNDTVQNLMWSNGATVLDKQGSLAIASPEAIAAYRFEADLFKFAPPGSAQYGNLEILNAFATGKAAHTIYPARMVLQIMRTNPKLADSVGVVMVPKGPSPNARYAATMYTKAWGFPKGTKNLALAKEFVKFLETGEREVRWLHSVPVHYWPPRKSTASSAAYNDDAALQSGLGKLTAAVIVNDALPGAQAQLTEAGVVNTQSFKILQAHVLAKMMQKIVLGNIPVDKAVADAVGESKQLLAR